MTNKKTKERFGNVVMISLLLSPIIQTYGWGRFDFASLLTLTLSVFSLIMYGKDKQKMPFFLGMYLAFWYFSHIVSNNFPGSLFPLGIVKIILVYLMFYNSIRIDYFIKKYRTFALVCIAFFLLQTVTRYLFDYILVGVFDFLPLANASDTAAFFAKKATDNRDCSFFSEPAIFVQYLLPLLTIELFYFKKKSWSRIILIVFCLLLMRSGNAVWGILIIGIFYVWSYTAKKVTAKSVFSFLLMVSIAGIGAYYYINSSMGQELMDRSDTIRSDSYETRGYAGSGFLRIYRGYYIYSEYPTLYKIIGNDNNDYIEQAINHSPFSWAFEEETYVNTVQAFLIYTGIIGTLLFLVFFVKQWKETKYCGRVILALIFALSFIAALHFTEIMAIYLLLPYAMKKEEDGKEIIVSRV